jgi:hypothetical protein
MRYGWDPLSAFSIHAVVCVFTDNNYTMLFVKTQTAVAKTTAYAVKILKLAQVVQVGSVGSGGSGGSGWLRWLKWSRWSRLVQVSKLFLTEKMNIRT